MVLFPDALVDVQALAVLLYYLESQQRQEWLAVWS
jgi:hypothetical protein